MRVLVCGGREFAGRNWLFATLDLTHRMIGIMHVIHGAARGADSLAGEWARARGVPELRFPAEWNRHGRAAGPLRNQRMLEEGFPNLVIAFPGGTGTKDMVTRARAAGVTVYCPTLQL